MSPKRLFRRCPSPLGGDAARADGKKRSGSERKANRKASERPADGFHFPGVSSPRPLKPASDWLGCRTFTLPLAESQAGVGGGGFTSAGPGATVLLFRGCAPRTLGGRSVGCGAALSR
jgi:hypothetical protein